VSPSGEFSEYLWTGKSLESFGLDAGKFPAIVPPGTKTGAVTAAASRRFGLPAGMPVYSGGPDFLMSLLGTAATRPGRVCDRRARRRGSTTARKSPWFRRRSAACPTSSGPLQHRGNPVLHRRLFEWSGGFPAGQNPLRGHARGHAGISGSRGFSGPTCPGFFRPSTRAPPGNSPRACSSASAPTTA
jgi:hypothetical protein